MKAFLKSITYSWIAIRLAQVLLGTFAYLENKSLWLIVTAFALLNIFKRPMLDIVSLPTKGFLYHIFSAFLSAVLLTILVAILPDLELMAAILPSFNIFGYMVASTYLSPFLSGILAAVVISMTSNYFYWLGSKK